MPLGEDLLDPISGNNPSGENLRYSPIIDKIKEARRKEDPILKGDYQRALKEADYRLVIKLSKDTLKRHSKDLQIAAWLTEALVYEEGLPGLKQGLDLLRELLEKFWDTIYPEIEDGDTELRAAPLSWVGDYRDMEVATRSLGLTKSGFGWLKYKESRDVGYEADVGDSTSKQEARQEATNEGKLTAEEFDADVADTPLTDLQQAVSDSEAALESLKLLDEVCQEKFGDEASSFRMLRGAIEDVYHTARILVGNRGGSEPQSEPEPEPEEIEEDAAGSSAEDEAGSESSAAQRAAPASGAKTGKRLTAEPADRDDAIQRVGAVAAYLRRDNPQSPVPYLILRGLRWGELRAVTDSVSPDLLEAPPTEIRQQIKRHMLDGEWDKALEAAESAMALPCGRGWLDLQRYVVRACAELGSEYNAIAAAVQSELRALLKDFPGLPEMTLMDDTATANAETQAWLSELTPAAPAASSSDAFETAVSMEQDEEEPVAESVGDEPADPFDLAMEEARAGNGERAMQILTRQISQERSGRGRFMRRKQLAQVCIFLDLHAIAYPILQDLAGEIETRKLEAWEQPEAVAQPLALLLQSMQKLRFDKEERHQVYSRICRLDPVQAARLVD